MLSSYTPVATLPVSDQTKARGFYEHTLGLTTDRDEPGGVSYNCGGGKLFVYESAYAGTNKGTAVSFDVPVSDFDSEVDWLRGRGVAFTTFDAEGVEWNDGVATMGPRSGRSGSPTRTATSSISPLGSCSPTPGTAGRCLRQPHRSCRPVGRVPRGARRRPHRQPEPRQGRTPCRSSRRPSSAGTSPHTGPGSSGRPGARPRHP